MEDLQESTPSVFEAHFRYCCPVWGAAGITALQKLQKLQNRAARIVTNSAYDAHSEPLIQKLGWPTIKQLIESETAKVVYKALHNEAPIPLFKMFSGQKCFEFRGTRIRTNLSNEAKRASTFLAFKYKL